MRSTSCALASGSFAGPGQSTAILPGASGHNCTASGFERSARVDDRRELFIVHRDQLGRVLCGERGFRDHHGDRLADMHHALAGERRPVRQDELLAAATGERVMAADIADAGRIHVGGGEDGEHAGRFLGLVDRDAADVRGGVRRADEGGIGLTGLGGIGDETAGAAHQIVVLDARAVRRMAVDGSLNPFQRPNVAGLQKVAGYSPNSGRGRERGTMDQAHGRAGSDCGHGGRRPSSPTR